MDTFTATMIAEGVDETDKETTLEAWAVLIKTKVVWSLQGWFGRAAQALIDNGVISQEGEIDWERVAELEEE